jgi:hypothetical protein
VNTPRRRCPVCWRLVARTLHGCIEPHWDSLGADPCVGMGEPYRITLSNGRSVAA